MSFCVLCSRLFPDRSHSVKQTTAKGNRGLGPEWSVMRMGSWSPRQDLSLLVHYR